MLIIQLFKNHTKPDFNQIFFFFFWQNFNQTIQPRRVSNSQILLLSGTERSGAKYKQKKTKGLQTTHFIVLGE